MRSHERLLKLLNEDAEARLYFLEKQDEIEETMSWWEQEAKERGFKLDRFRPRDLARKFEFMAGRWYQRLLDERGPRPIIAYANEDGASQTVLDVPTLVLELLRTGDIFNVKQCECGKWMVARRKDQTSCSTACRQRKYERKRPDAREERRIYKRWRYIMGFDNRHSPKWVYLRQRRIPMPTLDEWKRYGEPSLQQWEKILKNRKKGH